MSDSPQPPGVHDKRDAETLIALGLFMVVMATPVILATPWAGPPYDQVVNFGAGATLLAIGVAMLYKGRRGKRKAG